MEIQHSYVVLDTCCVLNFCASGYLIEILESIPAQVVFAEMVRDRELPTLRKLRDESNEDAGQFETATGKGLLSIVEFDSELEEETFINYVFELGDDGESATGAIAFHRDWAIATDDKKAISFFQREAPDLQNLSTLAIVKHWSEKEKLPSTTLQSALSAIRARGCYIPHRNHPLLSWWEDVMG